MKYGTIVEMFRKPLREGIVLAKELGFEGIQIYGMQPEFNLLERSVADVRELKKQIDDNDLVVSAVCADMPGCGYADVALVPERIENMKRLIDKVLELDCHILTNHVGVIEPGHFSYSVMVDSIGTVASYAASCGATVAIETGPEPATALKHILTDINSSGLGINLDPANLKMVLNEDPAAAVRLLAGHIVHTHAKDGVFLRACNPRKVYKSFDEGGFEELEAEAGASFKEVPLGEGDVCWSEYIQALRDINYSGFLTVEREVGDNPVKDISAALDFLRVNVG